MLGFLPARPGFDIYETNPLLAGGMIAHAIGEKTDLPNVKGEVKRAIKNTFAHLCTTLTRDKCLPLFAVKGESSGDIGRFCHAFNPYL